MAAQPSLEEQDAAQLAEHDAIARGTASRPAAGARWLRRIAWRALSATPRKKWVSQASIHVERLPENRPAPSTFPFLDAEASDIHPAVRIGRFHLGDLQEGGFGALMSP
jgi:hypothetical protein